VDAKTKHWIADLKMNGSVRAITFTPDGEYILGSGSDGDVYRWELKSRRCVERFPNEDGTITSSLSASMKHLAVGAESGVVNLYSEHASSERTPIKSIMNMHTSADCTRFNHDGQILAMSSRRDKNSMKLLHVPTATVFSNWPTSKTPLNYVWSMDFSPQSRFMAIGNDKGKCLLYKLSHYQDS
jgi:U3 small nucleolar RNA-associated protein 18